MDGSRINSVNKEHLNDDEEFLDIQTGTIMSRDEFIAQINSGKYPGYYVSSNKNDPDNVQTDQ